MNYDQHEQQVTRIREHAESERIRQAAELDNRIMLYLTHSQATTTKA